MTNERLYICNVKDPVNHCREQCPCGKPHIPDNCTKLEYCGIVDTETKCRPLTKKEKERII